MRYQYFHVSHKSIDTLERCMNRSRGSHLPLMDDPIGIVYRSGRALSNCINPSIVCPSPHSLLFTCLSVGEPSLFTYVTHYIFEYFISTEESFSCIMASTHNSLLSIEKAVGDHAHPSANQSPHLRRFIPLSKHVNR